MYEHTGVEVYVADEEVKSIVETAVFRLEVVDLVAIIAEIEVDFFFDDVQSLLRTDSKLLSIHSCLCEASITWSDEIAFIGQVEDLSESVLMLEELVHDV